MRLKLWLSLAFLLISSFSFAQKLGTWEAHFSYTDTIKQIVDAGDRLYVQSKGKLYSYYPADDYLETHYRKDRGNSDIVKIEYNEKNDVLVIFREDYDIDLLHANGNFVNIPYLKEATQNLNKALNNIYCIDDLAYLSTNFGLLVLDVAKEEVKEVGLFNQKFYSTCIFGEYLYGASENGVVRVPLNLNMQDINNWEKFDVLSRSDETDFADADVRWLFQFRDKLCFLVYEKRIYGWDNTTDRMEVIDGYGPVRMDYISNDRIVNCRWGAVWVFDQDSGDYFQGPVSPGYHNQAVIPKRGTTDEFWAGVPNQGLALLKKVENSYEILEGSKNPTGPWTNTPFYMTHEFGKLLVTGGGYADKRLDYQGFLSKYEKGLWSRFDPQEVTDKLEIVPRDYTSVIVDPLNPKRMFVSSWGDGLYEFADDKPTKLHTPANTNGVLEDIYGGSSFIRIGDMSFDKAGNLWLTNALVTAPIKVLQKDGVWMQIKHNEIGTPSPEEITGSSTSTKGIRIDWYNRKWVYTISGSPFLFILDDNKTPSNILDDKKKHLTSFVDQDNKSISVSRFNDLREDLSGNIWVATSVGPFVIYGSSNIFNRDIIFNKIKIPRNDGTNNVDILLEGTNISTLAIDGANRKWMGTPYGAYLVSANGLETIHHFNTDNSPMPSNEVISLTIDPDNGTVYIGTDKGIVSFVGDAIDGKPDYSNVYAFPNPVRPEYEGLITITGLQANSNVKITDVRGNILKQGTSLGGQYIWDGRNPSGNRVDTGVYLVLGATEDGKSGVVTKILVVN